MTYKVVTRAVIKWLSPLKSLSLSLDLFTLLVEVAGSKCLCGWLAVAGPLYNMGILIAAAMCF